MYSTEFWSWVVHVLHWVKTLANTKYTVGFIYFIECWIGWVVHTCTPHICLLFKVISTVLADCGKLMVVHLLLRIKILANSKLPSNLVGSTCTTPHVSIVFNAIVTVLADCAKFMVEQIFLWILIMMAINLIYGLLARKGSTCTLWILISGSTWTPLNHDLGQFTLQSDLFNLWNAG